MAEYLHPGYVNITQDEQRGIFSLRNRMIEISENFPNKIKKEKCNCGKELSMKHLYLCDFSSEIEEKDKPTFEKIF